MDIISKSIGTEGFQAGVLMNRKFSLAIIQFQQQSKGLWLTENSPLNSDPKFSFSLDIDLDMVLIKVPYTTLKFKREFISLYPRMALHGASFQQKLRLHIAIFNFLKITIKCMPSGT